MIHVDRYERMWFVIVGLLMGSFVAALVATSLVYGIHVPSPAGRIDPTQLDNTEFATPGLTQDGEKAYTLRVVAHMWKFDFGIKGSMPSITIPAGSRVKILATAKDVTHGFYVEQHNVNVMLVPGQVSQVSLTFAKPGVYHIICHEYCGPGHQTMIAVINVQ